MKSLQEELREARDQSQKVQEILAQVQQSQESQQSTELPVRLSHNNVKLLLISLVWQKSWLCSMLIMYNAVYVVSGFYPLPVSQSAKDKSNILIKCNGLSYWFCLWCFDSRSCWRNWRKQRTATGHCRQSVTSTEQSSLKQWVPTTTQHAQFVYTSAYLDPSN